MPINHPFGNGKHTTYKNGDDCGMVDDIVLPTLVVKNGEIRMNNSECASFLNPYHLNVAMVDKLEDLRVPWCLRGSFLMNLTGSLIVSSVFHCGLTTAQRLENSLCGFYPLGFRIHAGCRNSLRERSAKAKLLAAPCHAQQFAAVERMHGHCMHFLPCFLASSRGRRVLGGILWRTAPPVQKQPDGRQRLPSRSGQADDNAFASVL